jgi:SanA protein
MRKPLVRAGLIAAIVLCVAGLFLAITNLVIVSLASGRLYQSVRSLPFNQVGLVLGTNRTLSDGRSNPFYQDRIAAAARLYEAGKVRRLIVSGGVEPSGQSQAAAMKRDLEKKGVPATAITTDAAGFRTLDSVLRAHDVYGLDRFTVVTQCFHASRAVAIARKHGLSAIAYCTPNPPGGSSLRVEAREVFARARAFLDLYVLHSRPRGD